MNNFENDFLVVGWCWHDIAPAPHNDIYNNGEFNVVKIMKSVEQIHSNCMLNIDEEKKSKLVNIS